MRYIVPGVTLSLGAIVLATVLAPAANAGCGPELLKQNSSWSLRPDHSSPALQLASLTSPSIVGMWEVTFTSKGKPFDFGYSIWNSDGTEFLNSGARAPSTQNYCLGVWKQTKPDTYSLNHLALSYDTSGKLNARVRIREEVKLSANGNSYSGVFAIDAFDAATGKTQLQHVAGAIKGKRVTLTTSTEVD